MQGRRRRTLPPGYPGSTIRAARLNDRVRDGNGCDPRAIVADQCGVDKTGYGERPAVKASRAFCRSQLEFIAGELRV